MKLFSRTSPEVVTSSAPSSATSQTDASDGTVGKGRPTPSRKEAEAARKHTLKVPTDPKEAKRAARARAAEERQTARAGLMAGDEKYLPARDQGPVRAFVRDYIDARWAAAEMFLPLALIVLLVGFLPFPEVQRYVSTGWMLLTLFILVDTTLIMFRMKRELKKRWPEDPALKGTTLYGVMRVLQLRRLRVPPPRVRPGGRPVKVKQPKTVQAADSTK